MFALCHEPIKPKFSDTEHNTDTLTTDGYHTLIVESKLAQYENLHMSRHDNRYSFLKMAVNVVHIRTGALTNTFTQRNINS